MRLIDADELIRYIQYNWGCDDCTAINCNSCQVGMLIGDVQCAPTVDPVKHAHWVEENTRTHSMQFKCSVCGRIAYYPQNHHSTEPKRCGYAYCPNCGAKMEEEE